MNKETKGELLPFEQVDERFFELIKEGYNTRSASRKIKKEWGFDAVFFYGITKREKWEI